MCLARLDAGCRPRENGPCSRRHPLSGREVSLSLDVSFPATSSQAAWPADRGGSGSPGASGHVARGQAVAAGRKQAARRANPC